MKVIADIEIGEMKITSTSEMAEAFNCHFANTGLELARDIPPANTVPESYLISKKRLSLLNIVAPKSSQITQKLETKKATGLDNLPSKMLNIVAGLLAPSLTFLFNQSISSGIVPTEWSDANFQKGQKTRRYF